MSLESRFHAIDAFLLQWQWLWREVPFKQPRLSWFDSHPQWKSVLDAIDDKQLQRLALDANALYAFAGEQLQINIEPALYRIDTVALPTSVSDQTQPDGISARKWQQIQAFVAALKPPRGDASTQQRPPDVIEWCAGKGHLSRALLQQNICSSALGLEWDAALIERGNSNVARDNLALQLLRQDVLDNSVANHCAPNSHHVALHACGNLHLSMLRHCCAGQAGVIDLVPCCYHKIDGAIYQPLSLPARRSALQLDGETLKLALQETVTAPAGARRTRERLQQWRLGFDALQRRLRAADSYLSIPSMGGAMANLSFGDFCRHCAALKHIDLPTDIDYGHFEAIGLARFNAVSRYDLVRQLFRRPVELWLALDRCLFLAERGYAVELKEFCARELTPRNLWIHAHFDGQMASTRSETDRWLLPS